MLGTPNPNVEGTSLRLAETPTRQLRDLVKYLGDKNAGGVVSLGTPEDSQSEAGRGGEGRVAGGRGGQELQAVRCCTCSPCAS